MAQGGDALRKLELVPRHLKVEELLYELAIRGVTHRLNSREDLARLFGNNQLRDVLDTEVEKRNPEQELVVLRTKMAELSQRYAEVRATIQFHQEPSRLSSLYLHIAFRLRRIIFFAAGATFDEMNVIADRIRKWQRQLRELLPGWDFPLSVVREEEVDVDLAHAAQRLSLDDRRADDRRADDRRANDRRVDDRRVDDRRANDRRASDGRMGDEEEHRRRGRSPDGGLREDWEERGSLRSGTAQRVRRRQLSDSEDDDSVSSRGRHRRQGRNPMTSWRMRFGGSEDLARFLEDVEEQARLYYVDEEELLDGIGCLLTGSAKVWYRAYRDKLATWQVFKNVIADAFLAVQDDDVLLDKIKRLQQRSDESYMLYETRVQELIRRMRHPPSEEKQIRLLLDGMLRFYRERISAREIRSLVQLRNRCCNLEVDRADMKRRDRIEKTDRERERNRDPDDRHRRKPLRVDEVVPGGDEECRSAVDGGEVEEEIERMKVQVEVGAAALGAGPGKATLCWRCGRYGHFSTSCRETVSCLVCGLKDVIAENCRRCAQARVQGLWSQHLLQHSQPQQLTDFARGVWQWGPQTPLTTPAPLIDLSTPPPSMPQMHLQWTPRPQHPIQPCLPPQRQQLTATRTSAPRAALTSQTGGASQTLAAPRENGRGSSS